MTSTDADASTAVTAPRLTTADQDVDTEEAPPPPPPLTPPPVSPSLPTETDASGTGASIQANSITANDNKMSNTANEGQADVERQQCPPPASTESSKPLKSTATSLNEGQTQPPLSKTLSKNEEDDEEEMLETIPLVVEPSSTTTTSTTTSSSMHPSEAYPSSPTPRPTSPPSIHSLRKRTSVLPSSDNNTPTAAHAKGHAKAKKTTRRSSKTSSNDNHSPSHSASPVWSWCVEQRRHHVWLRRTKVFMNVLAKVLLWCSIMATAAGVIWYSLELKTNGTEGHLIAWFSAGAFVILGFPISIYGIFMHLTHYYQPNIQCYIVRILWMVPIYSIESWLCLRFHKFAIYIETLRDCYEAFVLYSFLQFLINVLGGETELILVLKDKSPTRGSHMKPLNWCVKPWLMGQPIQRQQGGVVQWTSPFFVKCKFGVLQYVLLKYLTAIATMLLELAGLYKEGDFSPKGGYLYICIITNTSQCWALYCLAFFYYATKNELAPIRPIGKFLSVKALVFFTWWQSLGIAILFYYHMIPSYKQGVFELTEEDVAKVIQDYLICIEMFIAAIVHYFVFPHTEFSDNKDAALSSRRKRPHKHPRVRLGRYNHFHAARQMTLRERQKEREQERFRMEERVGLLAASAGAGGSTGGRRRGRDGSLIMDVEDEETANTFNKPMGTVSSTPTNSTGLSVSAATSSSKPTRTEYDHNDTFREEPDAELGLSTTVPPSMSVENPNCPGGEDTDHDHANDAEDDEGDHNSDSDHDDESHDHGSQSSFDQDEEDEDDDDGSSQGTQSTKATATGFVRAFLDSAVPRDVVGDSGGIMKGDYFVQKKTLLHHAATSDDYALFCSNPSGKFVPRARIGKGGAAGAGASSGVVLAPGGGMIKGQQRRRRSSAGSALSSDGAQSVSTDTAPLLSPSTASTPEGGSGTDEAATPKMSSSSKRKSPAYKEKFFAALNNSANYVSIVTDVHK